MNKYFKKKINLITNLFDILKYKLRAQKSLWKPAVGMKQFPKPLTNSTSFNNH